MWTIINCKQLGYQGENDFLGVTKSEAMVFGGVGLAESEGVTLWLKVNEIY